jgi:hypothetical protein
MTRRLTLLLALSLLGGPGLAQAPQSPAPERELVVRNGTASVMRELRLNEPGASQPGPDLLGRGVLNPGQSFRARLPTPPACAMELRAAFEDGTSEDRAVDLCAPRPVEFTDAAMREIELVNETDFQLRELYLGPPSGARGPDRLGMATVPPLDSLRLRLRGQSDCAVELRAVFGGAPEERRRVDICATPRLVFGDASVPLREATIANRATAVLRELYLRDAGATEWGADRLGEAVLRPGQSFLLRSRRAACRVDLRAVFEGGREETRPGLDLCGTREIVFGPARRLALRHAHLRPIREVYLSPAEASDWGPNLLGDRPLARGEQREIGMEGGCRADLRIVFDNGGAEELRGFDLCQRKEIALRPGWVAE